MMRRVLLAVAAALPLAACQHAVAPAVPTSLLSCADAPTWRRGGTQRDVAGYVVDLRDAHADCRDRLGAVRGLVGARP